MSGDHANVYANEPMQPTQVPMAPEQLPRFELKQSIWLPNQWRIYYRGEYVAGGTDVVFLQRMVDTLNKYPLQVAP